MEITEKYYNLFQRLRTDCLTQLGIIDAALAELEKERKPPVPRQRRNLKDERLRELQINMAMGVVKKPSWLKKQAKKK